MQSDAAVPVQRREELRARVAEFRGRAHALFHTGATGIQTASALSAATDALIVDLFQHAFEHLNSKRRALTEQHTAVIAVGGSGRGELAPYSDTDLLFLHRPAAAEAFTDCTAPVVRDCWDAGLKLGHSVRTVADAIAMGRQDNQFATALVESRRLWGSEELFDRFLTSVKRSVVGGNPRAFVQAAVANRDQERAQHGATVHRLEPDVKRSLGGLRDVHLLRWLAFAYYGTTDVDSLRLRGGLSKDDARLLLAALEFLTRIRIDLHFTAGRAQDVLTREEQLRIAAARGIEPTAGQLPVERFMQTYFQHSTAIATIVQRFLLEHRRPPLWSRVGQFVLKHRADGVFEVDGQTIDVCKKHRQSVATDLRKILKLFHAASLYGVRPTPEFAERLKLTVPGLPPELPPECARQFLEILSRSSNLGRVLRSMYATGVLEQIVPDMAHARFLLQFNQYHSYTVDEHTLRAVEAATDFDHDPGPVGMAYRLLRHKHLLHLALLLHDLGKGFDEDHSEVGRRIAERVARRLDLPDEQRELLVFLVHKHLLMAHVALRRNLHDEATLVQFSCEVGSPETLRMLYVLTAADLIAVGPGIWTEWKAELLTELFDRAMLILSGKRYQFQERERMDEIKRHVRAAVVPLDRYGDDAGWMEWIERQLDALPSHYLAATNPARIAADLDQIQQLQPGGVAISGKYEPETATVEYRIIAHRDLAPGCFHKIAGMLTAKRLGILSAQISTSFDGTVIDSFRVQDTDYAADVPQERTDEVADAIARVLRGQVSVEEAFQRHKRFGASRDTAALSNLPTRIVIDNNSSDRSTIIDVFAHDRPGLLYTISRTLYELGLSVMLAKIATHLDQVVDVFYVTDADGRKITDRERLRTIHTELARRLEDFTAHPPARSLLERASLAAT
jgi:[protein-PII] uridylyltransferase